VVGWIPKLGLARELWPGGPSLREAFEAQLSPDGKRAASGKRAADSPAVQLLLLLR
jgi:hypothetical protein